MWRYEYYSATSVLLSELSAEVVLLTVVTWVLWSNRASKPGLEDPFFTAWRQTGISGRLLIYERSPRLFPANAAGISASQLIFLPLSTIDAAAHVSLLVPIKTHPKAAVSYSLQNII